MSEHLIRTFLASAAIASLAACQVAATGSVVPSTAPSAAPSVAATVAPSAAPSAQPTKAPSAAPSASPSGAPSASPSAVPTVAFKDLGKFDKDNGALPVTTNQRLKTQAELTALLDKLATPQAERPTVDFTKKEVLAFYDAGGPTGCYQLVMTALQNKGTTLEPVLEDETEREGGVCTQAVVPPQFMLYEIDKTTLPVTGF